MTRLTAMRWVMVGDSRYWDKVVMAKVISGQVIMERYMSDPIISQYIVFPDGESRVAET